MRESRHLGSGPLVICMVKGLVREIDREREREREREIARKGIKDKGGC